MRDAGAGRPGRWGAALGVAALAAALGLAPPDQARTRDGRTLAGRLEGAAADGFRFAAEAGAATPLEALQGVELAGEAPDPAAAPPPFVLLLADGGRISGNLEALDERRVRFDAGLPSGPLALPREAVRGVAQRPGEAVVFGDDFEADALAEPAWRLEGPVATSPARARTGRRALLLPAAGAAARHALAEPIAAGSVELAYFEEAAGRPWAVELTFRAGEGAGAATLRIRPSGDPGPAVETPGGPSLAVQRLERRPGWHRLVVRFRPEATAISLDGLDLAHGAGPGGPLAALALTAPAGAGGPAPAPADPATFIDAVRVARRAETTAPAFGEPGSDEVRRADGDQLFGAIRAADAGGVTFVLPLDDRPRRLPWGAVAGLYLRRARPAPAEVRGLLATVEWAPPGAADEPPDRLDGALAVVDDRLVGLEVPFAGRVDLPRGWVRRIEPRGAARRLVLDPWPYHLGNRYDADRLPASPDGDALELPFALEAVPPGPARLVLDVVGVVGVEGTPVYSDLVRAGQLRTTLVLNGRPLGDLNGLVSSPNTRPERVGLALPAGVLRAGGNTLRIAQAGTREEPGLRDSLGLLGVALEWPAAPAAGAPAGAGGGRAP